MDETILNPSEGQENVVDSQQTTVNEPVNAGSGEVAPSQTDSKPIQTPEQNAEYARVRRESEAKAKDQVIAEMYGESHGIYTYADYQKAIAEQQAEQERQRLQEETGIDPNALKPIFEEWKKSDPDFQELSKARQQNYLDNTIKEFNSEMKDLGLEFELKSLDAEELKKLPNVDKITNYVKNGYSLTDAYFLANKKDILGKKAQSVQQETINKITANGQSSPGSLGSGGETEVNSVYSMSKTDFAKMQEQVLRGERKKL